MDRKTLLQLASASAVALAWPGKSRCAQTAVRPSPTVKRWDLVTVGNLARNRRCAADDAKP